MQYRSYNNGGNFFWLGLLIFFALGGFRTLFLFLPLIFSLAPIFLIGYFVIGVVKKILFNSGILKAVHGANDSRLHFVELMIHLMVYAMKVDGKVDRREVQAIMLFFQQRLQFSGRQLLWVQDLIQHAVQKHYPLDDLIVAMNQEFDDNVKRLVFECLILVVVADETVDAKELELLNKIVDRLTIDQGFYQQLKQKYMQSTASDYDVLGISSTSTPAEIKKAYRELCKKYHPDKVQHLGDEFRKFSEDKIKEINKAYENISQTSRA